MTANKAVGIGLTKLLEVHLLPHYISDAKHGTLKRNDDLVLLHIDKEKDKDGNTDTKIHKEMSHLQDQIKVRRQNLNLGIQDRWQELNHLS